MVAGARVPSSPQAMCSLRSKAAGLWNTWNMFTSFVTANPSPLSSSAFFESVGHAYATGSNNVGKPNELRPDQVARWRIVARNPVKAAIFFHTFVQCFQEVYLGWPPGEDEQTNPNCLFGQVELAGLVEQIRPVLL
eukprot:GHUV01049392.1.p1 GENE.GHUV01049392.1~~GHUV01049392.1.p1  ORF type:complete len:136 (-),score=15.01 GHUV01049392.1:60-467(-)